MKLVILACLAGAVMATSGCGTSRNTANPRDTPMTPTVAPPPVAPPPGNTATTPSPSPANSPAVASSAPSEPLIVTPDDGPAGKIVLVNGNAGYVVLSFPIGALPAPNSRLNVYREGLKVGEIKITGPERDFNTVADVEKGTCQIGDQVRFD